MSWWSWSGKQNSSTNIEVKLDRSLVQQRLLLEQQNIILDELLDFRRNIMITAQQLLDAANATKAEEEKIVGILQQVQAQNKDLAQQLADAIANGDQTAMQQVLDTLRAGNDEVDQAIAGIQNP